MWTKAEEKRFSDLIFGMAETFRAKLTEIGAAGYRAGLGDIPFEAVKAACERALQTSEFMPTVAKIRDLAGVVEIKPEDRVIKAWGCLMVAMKKHTFYTNVRFDDGILNATVRCLCGWIGLFEMNSDELQNVFFARFKAAYLTHLKLPPKPGQCGVLVGQFGLDNGKWTPESGYAPTPGSYTNVPIFIATDLPPLVALPAPVKVKTLPAPRRDIPALPAPKQMLTDMADARIGLIESPEEAERRERADLQERQRQLQAAIESKTERKETP